MSAKLLALFLRALSLVESGGNPHAVGGYGELGAYQMTPAAVREFGGYDEAAATRAVRQLEKRLTARRVDPNPFNLVLAWNAGFSATIHGRAPVSSYREACRVRNLMEARK